MIKYFLFAGMIVLQLAGSGVDVAVAQTDPLLSIYNQGRAHEEAGRYTDAIPFYRKLVKLGEDKFGVDHPTTSTMLNHLARLHMALRQFDAAEPLYKRALDIYEKGLSPENKLVALGHFNLARVYHFKGRYDLAEPFYKRSVAIYEKALGPDHLKVARSLFGLGEIFQAQKRYADAVSQYKRSLLIKEKKLGSEHTALSADLTNLANIYKSQKRYNAAETLYKYVLSIMEKAYGRDHLGVAYSIRNLGLLYKAKKQHDTAEQLFKRAVVIREKALGPHHLDVATSLNDLGVLYYSQRRYKTAKPWYKRALAIREKTFKTYHPDITQSLYNLAILYKALNRYSDAEVLLERALRLTEKKLGPDHPKVASYLHSLAGLNKARFHYVNAETHYKRSLAIREKALGPEHLDVASSITDLAFLHKTLGRYSVAEPLYTRALKIREKRLGPKHATVAESLQNLAELYRVQGRYSEAEPLYKRSLAIDEIVLGPDHYDVARGLNNLATLYFSQGRYDDVEKLYKRGLHIIEKALGNQNRYFAYGLNNLALLYKNQKQYEAAEPLFKRSQAIFEALDPNHPDVGQGLRNLASLYTTQGKYTVAEPLYKRSVLITEKALGPDHPNVAHSLNSLGLLYQSQGQHSLADPFLKRSLAIKLKLLRADHPNIASTLTDLAVSHYHQGRILDALDNIRKASAIHNDRTVQTRDQRSDGSLSEQKQVSYVFSNHVFFLWEATKLKPELKESLSAEAFEASQRAHATSTAAAVAGMGARFAAKEDTLATLVRDRQDAEARWRFVDDRLVKIAGQPTTKRDMKENTGLRAELNELDNKLKKLDTILASKFPEYAELASPHPLQLDATQKLLDPSEAMLVYAVKGKISYLWVLRHNRSAMLSLDITPKDLDIAVKELRTGLDLTDISNISDIPAFNIKLAHDLYGKLIAPAELLLQGASHVFVVPDGPLQSLPLSVLVTQKPTSDVGNFKDYRNVSWLAKRYAMSTLPSVSSLKALRVFAKKAGAKQPFLGIGDPLLKGHPGSNRGVKIASFFTSRGIADVNAVRSLLAPLPDTADELTAMAKSLGADSKNLMLRNNATERILRSKDLTPYKVLAFATHGLVAGDLKGLTEPALVLTPPIIGSTEDDGLLTASEVAQLKLDADWVILSACNTAAGDGTPGAEGLSGLTKAFFYAGTRALLVSHWPVNSDAAVLLTTAMLSQSASNPNLARAEALQRSMLSLITNDQTPSYYAHPMFWAPFVVVGEGGVRQR